MTDGPITEAELEHYRTWIGRETVVEDEISTQVIRRIAAAMDAPMPSDGLVPAMWHYGLFLSDAPSASLGPDGHPPRGGALPPVRLSRRMFAGSEANFFIPLSIAKPAICRSKVISVDLRKGSQGDLLLVRVNDEIEQGGENCISETRTLVYLAAGQKMPPVVPDANLKPAHGEEHWQPDEAALFRFSAVTFNSHRIHYDEPYATRIEGYPALVVHGPFTALKLCALGVRASKSRPSQFTFRGEAPLFCGQPIILASVEAEATLQLTAKRCDGKIAMRAAFRTQN